MPRVNYFVDKYAAQDKFNFPAEDVDPKQKVEAPYILQYCEAIYSAYVMNMGAIRFSKLNEMETHRLYGQGRQPVEKYLDILCPRDKQTQLRPGKLNISWDILSTWPKFRSIMLSIFDKMEHEITAEVIDEKGGADKETAKMKAMAYKIMTETARQFEQNIDAEIVQDGFVPDVVPESFDHLEMLAKNGNFKLGLEIAMESLLKFCFNFSNWPHQVKHRMYEDIIDWGICAALNYTDPLTGTAKCRYINPKRLIARHSDDRTFSNIDYAGELKIMTPAELIEDSNGLFGDEEIKEILETYTNQTHYDYTHYDNIQKIYENHNQKTVNVMEIYWISYDMMTQGQRVDSRGKVMTFNEKYGYKVGPNNKNKSYRTGKKKMLYKAKWVVGTKYLYDYGHAYDIVRPEKNEAELPIKIFRVAEKSMTEQAIATLDMICMTWYRMQNNIAKQAPDGIAIDVSALKNVYNGENKLTPLEILRIRRTTGDLLYSATTHSTTPLLNPSAGKPVHNIQGGSGKNLEENMAVMDYCIKQLQQITGINQLVDASSPDPKTLKSVAQMAQEGTNNVLHQMYFGYKWVKESTARSLGFRIQYALRYGNEKPYENVLSKYLIKHIQDSKDISLKKWGINLVLKPTEIEKEEFIMGALEAQRAGRIKYSQFAQLKRHVDDGSIKLAQLMMAWFEEKNAEEEAARQERIIAAQGEEIRKQNAQSDQNKAEQSILDSDLEIKKDKAFTEHNIIEDNAKGETKKEIEEGKNETELEKEDKKITNQVLTETS